MATTSVLKMVCCGEPCLPSLAAPEFRLNQGCRLCPFHQGTQPTAAGFCRCWSTSAATSAVTTSRFRRATRPPRAENTPSRTLALRRRPNSRTMVSFNFNSRAWLSRQNKGAMTPSGWTVILARWAWAWGALPSEQPSPSVTRPSTLLQQELKERQTRKPGMAQMTSLASVSPDSTSLNQVFSE